MPEPTISNAVLHRPEIIVRRAQMADLDSVTSSGAGPGATDEITKAVSFLVSDDSSYVNVVESLIDGGLCSDITEDASEASPSG